MFFSCITIFSCVSLHKQGIATSVLLLSSLSVISSFREQKLNKIQCKKNRSGCTEQNRSLIFFLNATEEKKQIKRKKHKNTHNGCFKDKTQKNGSARCFWFLLIFLSFVSGFARLSLMSLAPRFTLKVCFRMWPDLVLLSIPSSPVSPSLIVFTCRLVFPSLPFVEVVLLWCPQWCTLRLMAQRAVSSLTSEFSMSGKLLFFDLAKSPW